MTTLLDTGPLVALLSRRDRWHSWARAQFADLHPPLTTCEAVLAEACHLVRHLEGGPATVLDLVRTGILEVAFDAGAHAAQLHRLLVSYGDVPMSFADACLVRMSELDDDPRVMTVDSDFRVYRRNGRAAIPVLMPDQL